MKLAAILLLAAAPAYAADAVLCRPFASQYTQIVMNKVWMRAYTNCLNSDEMPSLPTDWQAALKRAIPDETPLLVPLAQEGTTPATGPSKDNDKSVVVAVPPAQVCARAHRRIIWKGYSWHCQ